MGSTHSPPNALPLGPVPSQPASSDVVPPAADEPLSPDEPTVITRRPASSSGGVVRPGLPIELGKGLAGQRLDHFELLEFVGGGGMGAVFRARDTMLGREVALKVLSRDQGADEETRRRFQNEAQSAARLDHENIARVYYVGEDRGLNYIAFEFIEGINLRELVDQKGPLALGEALSYTLQIARALEHASSRDVVHRDIKPSNVIITSEGRAKLVDMGLARLHQVNAPSEDLTASGVTLGTFDYISPEQARDPRSADVRSDIYSLGCTLYFMLTGRPPFPEGTVLQKLLQHNSDEPPDPRELNPSLPPELSDLVRKMLAKNPRRRYQSPAELMGDLLLLAEQSGITSLAWGIPVSAPLPERDVPLLIRHLPWLVPVAILGVLVLVLDFVTRPSSTELPALHQNLASHDRRAAKRPTRLPVETQETKTESPRNQRRRSPAEQEPQQPVVESSTVEPNASGPTDDLAPASVATIAGPSATADRRANSATSGGGESAAPAESDPLRPGLLVVEPMARGPQRYTSLRAACQAAKSGDVIELRYHGRREERPIALANQRFTIRSGEGYHPIVVFRPDDIDPLRWPRSMMTIAGGRLALLNVQFELEVPSPEVVPADSWSLFALERPEAVELDSCALTIRNRTDEVSFFHVRAVTGADSMMAADELNDEPPTLELENCVIRGEADVLRVSELEPVKLVWDNGLVVTSGHFLVATGGQVAPRHGHAVRISLKHLTAVVGQSFCRLTDSFDAPFLRETAIDCSDSILLATSTVPLVEQEGVEGASTFERQFSWHGDRNFYQDFDGDAFWRISSQNDPDQSERFTFPDWVSHWGQQHELLPTWGEVAWKHLPLTSRPVHLRTPEDYALSDHEDRNMARDGASDGRDVGAYAELLPPVPAEVAAVPARP